MNYSITWFKQFLLVGLCLISFSSHSTDSIVLEKEADSTIINLYQDLRSQPQLTMPERVIWISQHFLGTTYVLGALGEGVKGQYDQFPLYRTDGFDCDTFVNTVLSLALANSLASFKQCQRYNRYKNGKITYLNRNHFTSLDWNINNQQRGILKDITLNITDSNNKSVALNAVSLINKPSWYAHKTLSSIRLQKENRIQEEQLLRALKTNGQKLRISKATIPYLPFSALFKENKPNLYLFNQIPQGAIIEIVRPNWDLKQIIGTCLNVSHLGFAIKKDTILYFRQASSQLGKVVDVPLIDYLLEAKKNPTIQGINIQVIIPEKPLAPSCKKFIP